MDPSKNSWVACPSNWRSARLQVTTHLFSLRDVTRKSAGSNHKYADLCSGTSRIFTKSRGIHALASRLTRSAFINGE